MCRREGGKSAVAACEGHTCTHAPQTLTNTKLTQIQMKKHVSRFPMHFCTSISHRFFNANAEQLWECPPPVIRGHDNITTTTTATFQQIDSARSSRSFCCASSESLCCDASPRLCDHHGYMTIVGLYDRHAFVYTYVPPPSPLTAASPHRPIPVHPHRAPGSGEHHQRDELQMSERRHEEATT